MTAKRKKVNFISDEQGAVRAVAKIDGTANKGGRPVGSVTKGLPDYKKTKQGLIEAFNRSDAPAILTGMLNGRLPSFMKPENRDMLTVAEDAHFRRMLMKNFMWATEIIVKLVPKELGQFGRVTGELTLADLLRRATVSPKSPKVIDMVQKRRASELEEYVADEVNE